MSDFKPDIWRLQAQFNTEGLVEALRDDDAGIRRRAAAALRALGAFDAIPELKAALEKETDTEARANIVSALAALQHENERTTHNVETTEFVPSTASTETDDLITQLKSDDPQQIIEAANKLGEKGDKLAVPALVMLFNQPTLPIKVRLPVAEALLKLESAPVEVALLKALRSSEWRVRRNGAAILGQLRANWAVEPLAKALYDEHEHVRKTAYAALKYIGTKEAFDALDAARRAIRRKRRTTTETKIVADEPGNQPVIEQPMSTQEALSVDEDGFNGMGFDDDDIILDDTQKIVWPSKRRKPEDDNPTLAPTKPFDPKAIERAREQMERLRQQRDDNQ